MPTLPAALPVDGLEGMILLIRGQRVILDLHLAKLYGVYRRRAESGGQSEQRTLPQRFHVSTHLTGVHRSQRNRNRADLEIAICDFKPTVGRFAFTEQGVAMLSSVLRSERAVAVNIEIMRTFVRLRQLLSTHADLARESSKRWKRSTTPSSALCSMQSGS